MPAYYDHPLYIEALARSVETAYAGLDRRPDALVTSYHGMPERYLAEGDPYHCHCQVTTRLLRDRLGFATDEVVVTFQSRFGREEWLKPYTVEEVARLARAGKRHIAIMAPAFSADCVETLEEINGEIREAFLHAGGETFTYIPCLNAEARAHRHADGDRRARARRLALTPAQRSSVRGARRGTSAVAATTAATNGAIGPARDRPVRRRG